MRTLASKGPQSRARFFSQLVMHSLLSSRVPAPSHGNDTRDVGQQVAAASHTPGGRHPAKAPNELIWGWITHGPSPLSS
jgi:hypothetical protein